MISQERKRLAKHAAALCPILEINNPGETSYKIDVSGLNSKTSMTAWS